MTDRYCAHCGKPLVQRPSELDAKFKVRETCNFGCGAHLGHKRLVERAMAKYGITIDELARRANAGLCACGEPVRVSERGTRRKTCGRRQCRGFSAADTTDGYFEGERQIHWPVVTGEVFADFSGQNVAARDGGFGFKIVRADDRSYAGCSAAYTAGVA